MVPITPEEQLIDYNLRQLGASSLQIFVAISNHRYARDDENALRAALLLQADATFSQIDNIVRETRQARDQARSVISSLAPNGVDEIFPNLDDANPSSMINTSNATWALTAESIVGDDNATLAAGQQIIREIQALDPNYRPEQLERLDNLRTSVEARVNYIDRLRLQRAAAIYRVRGNDRPLQVETLRILQLEVERAYDAGQIELSAGRLTIYLSEEEALGNYIDKRTRNRLRSTFRSVGIDWITSVDIRIQRREYDTTGTDLTYRIPDAAVGDIMFDATITQKQPNHAQIREFFAADARPRGVIIVRPSVLGGSYFITPPRSRRPRR
jgi:hypothetical protein